MIRQILTFIFLTLNINLSAQTEIEYILGNQILFVDSALVFQPNRISTHDNESIVALSDNGHCIIFDRISSDFNDWTNYPFYITRNINGKWTEPKLTKHLGSPWFFNYPDPKEGKKIYYANWLPLNKEGQVVNIDIHKAVFVNGAWNSIKLPYPINTNFMDTWPSVSENGNLYFFSNRPGGIGQADIYRSVPVNGEYKTIENLGNIINSTAWEHDPCISKDESYIIYSSNMEGSIGADDLFISFQIVEGRWTKPVNLGSGINSSESDNRPYLSPDEELLFFSSNRNGNLDIYWIKTDFIQQLRDTVLMEVYCGQQTPSEQPVIFNPKGINNSIHGAFCSVFSPDINEFYFTRIETDGGTPGVIACISKEKGDWSRIDTLPFSSGVYNDNDMCISYEGTKMFFRSFRPLPDGTIPNGHTYLWYAVKTERGWSNANPLYCGGDLVISGYPSISKNDKLFFSSKEDGKNGIFKSEFINGNYASIELEYTVNDSIVTEGDLFIAPDESYMIISCYNHPENLYSSNGDLYIIFKNNGKWSKAINLGKEINTKCTENCPAVTPDGKYLFFNRYCEDSNEGNIYWVTAEVLEKFKSQI